ncbi:hypothetical protein FR483_n305L [Paramecium bursaria Chlorella virus FR483]|uniref:Uncharacterized protein n305L n=1 Tax=Paramecium bursaria Chlorella virus FR483 TaxID=399781 RepID=A7J709_PBCVF|nr:hypothetical protein FR483_n305L [Paramecium bursaria Chlorella virus FR483]ABT15590.1 hypothetical protein FR483_n305L [Paramecium bursaria Chlorella virus FR483]
MTTCKQSTKSYEKDIRQARENQQEAKATQSIVLGEQLTNRDIHIVFIQIRENARYCLSHILNTVAQCHAPYSRLLIHHFGIFIDLVLKSCNILCSRKIVQFK